MEVFERLRIARKKLGYTQEEFSHGLGIQRGSYSDLERGRVKTITESALLLLEISFGINREWLLHGTGEILIDAENAGQNTEINKLKAKIKDLEAENERLNGIILKVKDAIL
jgi:transcriptional regulator with XRE-family HTH domain